MSSETLITILGPTASGKTARAVSLARCLNAEIISADSRQVYRNMDIGTGKDIEEYGNVPYHLIDICEAGEKYNLYRYVSDFHRVFNDISLKGKRGILCGGSGMYLETVLSGISLPDVPENPELRKRLEKKTLEELKDILSGYKTLHNTTDVDTVKRAIRAIEIEVFYSENPSLSNLADRKKAIPMKSLIIGIDLPREIRRERISLRLTRRLETGMVQEVEKLLKKGVLAEDLIYYGLEYKFVTLYLTGQLTYSDMVSNLEIAIHQFAKRQMTWFRGMEKRGFPIHWLSYNLTEEEFNSEILALMERH